MSTWRYIAQRATTGEFLDFEVPFLERSELTWALSAAGSLKGTIPAAAGQLVAPDGRPMFEEWNTLIYAEADGDIRWGGIVVKSGADGTDWNIEAATFATYPFGMPFYDEFYGVEDDPADIVRVIWDHLQGFAAPRGDLGVKVLGRTPARVGSKSEAALQAATKAYNDASDAYKTAADEYKRLRDISSARIDDRTAASKTRVAANAALSAAKKTKDPAQIAAAQQAVDNANAAYNAADAAYAAADAAADAQADRRDAANDAKKAASDAKKAAAKVVKDDGGAYKLLWWDAPDCGQKIQELATATPFDFTERHFWNDDKTDILHRIDIAYPRAGRFRDDLSFVLGDNVISLPTPETNGDDYANTIIGLGNGDGAAMLHNVNAVDDGRLRRAAVLSNKDVKNKQTLAGLVRGDRQRSAASLTIPKITIRDHPNAPIGSFALGDDILVEATIPVYGDIAIRHRIVGWSLISDSTAELKLERSDSFTYGG